MSTHTREQWEAWGLQSSQALTLTEHIRQRHTLGKPEDWVAGVERRAIAAFVSYHTATTIKASGDACHEMLVVACARFGVNPEWFYTDDNGQMDATSVRALRADVAHYRIMHALDEEDE